MDGVLKRDEKPVNLEKREEGKAERVGVVNKYFIFEIYNMMWVVILIFVFLKFKKWEGMR